MKGETIPEECPFCGEQMEKGYLAIALAVTWHKEIKMFVRKPEMIFSGAIGKDAFRVAQRCKKCSFVQFFY